MIQSSSQLDGDERGPVSATKSSPRAPAAPWLDPGSACPLNIGWGWSSPAAGTAGQGSRFRMSDAAADPCTCNCFLLRLGAAAPMNQVCWLPLPLSLCASSSGCSVRLFKRRSGPQRSFFVASPADIQTRGYLIRIWCPRVPFTSQDGCVCLGFTDGPLEYQKHAPTAESILPTLVKPPSPLHFTSNRHRRKKNK